MIAQTGPVVSLEVPLGRPLQAAAEQAGGAQFQRADVGRDQRQYVAIVVLLQGLQIAALQQALGFYPRRGYEEFG